jgi:cysteine synthase A
MIYEDILQTIGKTPVVRINRLAPAHVNLFVKLESFNPMGSIKDRLALGVIEDAERRGALEPGQTVIEATSGNTGIGLAMACARKGYPLVVTMAENFSVERRRLMRFLGAKVVLTPAAQKGSGMLAKAVELAQTHGWFLTRQFENEANADIHSRTTAQEILADFEHLDYWVTSFGTGGTLKGVARVLRAERPKTRVIVAEPDNAPVLASGIAQTRAADGSPAESHPHFRPHPIQGTSPDFIAKLTEDAIEFIHEIVPVNGADAMRLSRELAQKEGIFVGISAGAAFAAGLKVAEQAPEGSHILCMLPDTGERYLSTPLFEAIDSEMNEEEWAISRSTLSARFDAPVAPPPASPAPIAAIETQVRDVDAEAFVETVISDASQPVVMFALEWCEFCWSVRRMLAALDIPYRSIDLDAAVSQQGDWGGRARRALQARTKCPTIPQVFIGGTFVGGCTELFDAWRSGKAQALLEQAGVKHRPGVGLDPYNFLPKWLHPRAA